ncbi:hypothetical protein HanRHA438_Chr09g0402951 [Helianthus annuus]|nr:hypothetical protein HanRHA438_Chr09g0402951 [Helianthus annuus]
MKTLPLLIVDNDDEDGGGGATTATTVVLGPMSLRSSVLDFDSGSAQRHPQFGYGSGLGRIWSKTGQTQSTVQPRSCSVRPTISQQLRRFKLRVGFNLVQLGFASAASGSRSVSSSSGV